LDPSEVDDARKITNSHEVTVCAEFADECGNRSMSKLLENLSEANDLSEVKDSSEVKTNGTNAVKEFHAWLIQMLLCNDLTCMLRLIIALIRSLKDYWFSLPLLQRLRLNAGVTSGTVQLQSM